MRDTKAKVEIYELVLYMVSNVNYCVGFSPHIIKPIPKDIDQFLRDLVKDVNPNYSARTKYHLGLIHSDSKELDIKNCISILSNELLEMNRSRGSSKELKDIDINSMGTREPTLTWRYQDIPTLPRFASLSAGIFSDGSLAVKEMIEVSQQPKQIENYINEDEIKGIFEKNYFAESNVRIERNDSKMSGLSSIIPSIPSTNYPTVNKTWQELFPNKRVYSLGSLSGSMASSRPITTGKKEEIKYFRMFSDTELLNVKRAECATLFIALSIILQEIGIPKSLAQKLDDMSPTLAQNIKRKISFNIHQMGEIINISGYHLHRQFVKFTGVTIRRYEELCRRFLSINPYGTLLTDFKNRRTLLRFDNLESFDVKHEHRYYKTKGFTPWTVSQWEVLCPVPPIPNKSVDLDDETNTKTGEDLKKEEREQSLIKASNDLTKMTTEYSFEEREYDNTCQYFSVEELFGVKK